MWDVDFLQITQSGEGQGEKGRPATAEEEVTSSVDSFQVRGAMEAASAPGDAVAQKAASQGPVTA